MAVTGTSQWKDKNLTKHFCLLEDGNNGTLTTGFTDEPAPKEGEEIEYTLEDKGFGNEIKLARKPGGGGGGFASKAWTPNQVAQQDAVKLTVAYITAGADLKHWKDFFVSAKTFMVANIEDKVTPVEVTTKTASLRSPVSEQIELGADDLPF